MTTTTGRFRRAMIAAVATAVLAPTSAVLLASEAAAATGAGIIDLADDNLGKRACSTNSLGGTGYYTSCKPEPWCSDFAKWVWANSGVPVGGLTPESGSFYTYGTNNGTRHSTPQVGDAVVFNYHGGGNADHVGLVSAVYSNGNIQVINGNFGGSSSTTSSVQYSSGPGRIGATIGTQRSGPAWS
jgi:cell wall-associated NlpC family hydrolase